MAASHANPDIAQRKKDLRGSLRHLRAGIPEDEREAADRQIAQALCGLYEFAAATYVLTYLSFGSEVQTRGIIQRAWQLGKVVALPRCVPHTRLMEWHVVTSLEGLVTSSFGVQEPAADESTLLDATRLPQALAVVPALAFDREGYRLGYGGGFYDTFLAGFPGTSAGICRRVQMRDSLRQLGVIDAHDLPVDMVVGQGEVWRTVARR
ncbi:MAG: 5-formyltetrahydrofolate cyclo-ligase [Atopobiaceae bacterium]